MAATWVEEEMVGLDLCDARLNLRCHELLSDLCSRPNASIPEAVGGGNAEVQAAYRFWANANVSAEAILAPHIASSRRRIAQYPSVVLVQDTTEIDVTRPAQEVQGAGPLDEGSRVGGFVHPLHAFTEEGTPLGTVHCQIWSRPQKPARKPTKAAKLKARAAARKRPIEEKESGRWVKGFQAAQAVAAEIPQTEIICVADSEADVYELFSETKAGSGNAQFLVRACQDRLLVPSRDESAEPPVTLLWAAVENAAVLMEATIEVRGREAKVQCETRGRRQARVSRTTVVNVRAARVTLRGPHRPAGRLPDVTVSAVLVREINPPAGEAPIEWLLITTLPIDTLAQVQRVIKLYAVRWKIELFFRMLKQGCRVEERRFEFQDRVERFLAMSLIVAWRISYMCHLGRECPEMSCEAVFSPEEWQVAYRVLYREKPPRTPPSLQTMIRIVAQLGGYVNRVREDEPGLQTLWRGMQRLNDMTMCWKLFSPDAKNSERLVLNNEG